MNFFESQAQARASSRHFVILFLLAVALIVAAVDTVAVWAFMAADVDRSGGNFQVAYQHDYGPVIVLTSLVTLGLIFIASLVRTAQLRGGGGVVARAAGGTLISADTLNPRYRRLRNVVEEIAIASGVPVPEIYVLEQETAINAFAAGWAPANAAIAVTRGSLEKLNRDELQGVIAHEFSHILNGDMRLNIRLMGLVFGILVLHIVGREVFNMVGRGRSSSRKGDPTIAILLVAIAVMILGWIGVFMGRVIKAAVARQRESLADASAVQFTRQTKGIAGALKKIAGIDEGSKLKKNAEEVSHMLFGDGIGLSSLLATHPPIEQRIKALEPSFRLEEIEGKRAEWNSPSFTVEDDVGDRMQSFDAGRRLAEAPIALKVGEPDAADFERAEVLHQSLAEDLLTAARGESGAALLMALLVQPDHAQTGRQLAAIESSHGAPAREQVQQLAARVQGLHPSQRLPLASIALPALRQLPRERILALTKTITFLINADGQVGVFEYCLSRLLRQQLNEVLHPSAARTFGNKTLPDCKRSVQVLLTVLAQQGHADGSAARAAYLAGLQTVMPREALPFQPIESWIPALDAALTDLDQLKPQATAPLIDALLATLNHDGRITVAEAELLRVVCASLHCPLPPLLGDASCPLPPLLGS